MMSTSFTDRPRQSNSHTHKVSVGRRWSSASTSPGGGGATGDLVFEDPAATGVFEGLALEFGVSSGGGDARVSDQQSGHGSHRIG
jgi:hypothetical protein